MNKWLSRIKENNLWKDFINVILGLAIIILLVLFVLFPGNGIILGFLFVAAGGMNLWTGVRQYGEAGRKGGRKNMGKRSAATCFILLGAIIMAVGVMVLKKMG